MDELTPFERRLTDVLDAMAGASPTDDAMEIARTARRRAPARRNRFMLNATRLAIGGAAIALAGGFLLTSIRPLGTDGAGVGTQLAAASPSPSPSPSPAGVPLPSGCTDPIAAVTGMIYWGSQAPGSHVYPDAAGGSHYRDWSYTSRFDLDDDRLDGTTTGTLDWDFFQSRAGVNRGTFKVENDGGTWEGPSTGIGSSTNSWRNMSELTGSGAYEGLSAILFMDDSGKVTGSVFPTILPTCDFAAGS